MTQSFGTLVDELLAAMERDSPASFRSLCAQLDGTTLTAEVDGERHGWKFSLTGVRRRGGRDGDGPALGIDGATIVDLVAGRLGLLDALRQDRLRMRGTPSEIARLHEAFTRALQAALRSPSALASFQRFQATVPGGTVGRS